MNAAHPVIRARSLASVLADLTEAKRDWDDALGEIGHLHDGDPQADDADDRATEAETRLDDLREEAAGQFARFNGITIEQFRKAFEDGLL